MCGLCGVWYFERQRPVDQPILQRMTATLAHRGPDDESHYNDQLNSISFGFRRLSIIDIQGSPQPILSENRDKCIVANGEIYNFRELRAQLCERHHFRTQGDIESILHLYEDEGTDCVHKLRGMFAFALWDASYQRLTLAVDQFGQKPLYYFCDQEKVVFASELKALLQFPGISRDLDLKALDEYLERGYITAPRSIFLAIHKLPPGHILTFDRSSTPLLHQYWTPKFGAPEINHKSFDELAVELRHRLTTAVRSHSISSVPLGAFLSGGIDSSAVVALLNQGIISPPVKTFSVAFTEPSYDESCFAHLVAKHYGTDHETVLVKPTDAQQILPALIRQFDEPFADSSMIPTFLLAQQARKSVKVVLSGDGGDEVFAGYFQHLYAYRQTVLEALIPQTFHSIAARAAYLLPHVVRVKPYLAALDQPYSLWNAARGFFSYKQRQQLYRGDYSVRISHHKTAMPSARDGLSQLQQNDLITYLPGDILVKMDRAAMLASLEVRSPLLDLDVWEFMARIPPSYRVSLRSGKRLFKKALEPLLPTSILQRPKQGFSIPQAEWLRTAFVDIVHDVLDRPQSGLFDVAYVQSLVHEHLARAADHKDRVWALLCFELWAQEYL